MGRAWGPGGGEVGGKRGEDAAEWANRSASCGKLKPIAVIAGPVLRAIWKV